MLAWHEVLTIGLTWNTYRHFRPSQSHKWITVKWLNSSQTITRGGCEKKASTPPPYDPFYSEFRAFTHYCHLHGPSLAQQINCNKILFSHTGIWLLVSFSLYFFIFCFFLLFYVILLFVNFYKHYFIRIGNSLICGDIWHKHHEWYFKIVIRNFTSRLASEIWDNFEISRVVFMPNITYKSCYYLFILLPAKGL